MKKRFITSGPGSGILSIFNAQELPFLAAKIIISLHCMCAVSFLGAVLLFCSILVAMLTLQWSINSCIQFYCLLRKTENRRRGGLVVERRTPEREVGSLILTRVTVFCP